jgi:hypothetical protein
LITASEQTTNPLLDHYAKRHISVRIIGGYYRDREKTRCGEIS